jgi:hypothetical protein
MDILKNKKLSDAWLNAITSCQPGQSLVNGVCVWDVIPYDCPSGTTWDGSQCVPDNQCQNGFYWNGSQCVPEVEPCPVGYKHDVNGVCVVDSTGGTCGQTAYPNEIFPPFMGTPCDAILSGDPHRCSTVPVSNATGFTNANGQEFHNVGEVTAIAGAIGAIGSLLGSILGRKKAMEAAKNQYELEMMIAEQKRRNTTNIIIGSVAVLAFGVSTWMIVRYVKGRKG